MEGKGSGIAKICQTLTDKGPEAAARLLRAEYPFCPDKPSPRKYRPLESTKIFVRDGFIDRYSGQKLVFPPVLRLLSFILPEDFPYHLHWKTDVTHPAYYELSATVDHLVPVSRGGSNEESNLVTTSMARNSAKGNWTLEDLGWSFFPSGNIREWDGLMGWFGDYCESSSEIMTKSWAKAWYRTAIREPLKKLLFLGP